MKAFIEWLLDGRKGRLPLRELPGYEHVKSEAYLYKGKLYGAKGKPIKGSWSRSRKYPYHQVTMMAADGRKLHLRLDRIIAKAFVDGRTEQRDEVDHINGVHDDDRPENLRWVTRQENIDAKVLREYKEPRCYRGQARGETGQQMSFI